MRDPGGFPIYVWNLSQVYLRLCTVAATSRQIPAHHYVYAVIRFLFQYAQRPHGGARALGSAPDVTELDETEPNILCTRLSPQVTYVDKKPLTLVKTLG